MSADARYEGTNSALRSAPGLLCVIALVIWQSRWNHSLQFATLFVVLAVTFALWIPWRFTVTEAGLVLCFAMGRRRFLPKNTLTIRVDLVGAFALVGKHRRFGYPLLDRILYRPGHDNELRTVFAELGFRVA
jgi:hypothetical protein